MPGAPGDPAAGGAPTGDISAGNIDFSPPPIDEIEPVSYNPIFTPAGNFSQLLKTLTTLRNDYQEAVKNGSVPLAIEKLTLYVRDDPKGKLLEWPTPPEELLKNHVCAELARALTEASKLGEAALSEAASQSAADPMEVIQNLDAAISQIERTIQDGEKNAACFEGGESSSAQVESLKQTRDRLVAAREDANRKLVLQRYEEVAQKVSAVGSDSDPEVVSTAIQSLTQFERILEERNNDYLTQGQLDRLKELQAGLEGKKEDIVKRVRQEAARLAADETVSKDAEKIKEILRLYDVLDVLKVPETDLARERRKWESTLSKLEAGESVREIRDKLREVRTALEKAEEDLAGGRVPQDALTVINDRMAEVQGIQKRSKEIRGVPGYGEISKEFNELRSAMTKLEARVRSLQNR